MLHWHSLVRLTDAELARIDIAAVNIACADGLPGAESIDIPRCMQRLDDLTREIKTYTSRAMVEGYLLHPEKYACTEAGFRVECMVRVLQQHRIRHAPSKRNAKIDDPYDLEDAFIHAPLCGDGGTCATLPIIYASIGRRLGYPIRLVASPAHLFNRWEDPESGETFNFEAPVEGWFRQTDQHYRELVAPVLPHHESDLGWMRSMTPRIELAKMLALRGHIWNNEGNNARAAMAYALADSQGEPYRLHRPLVAHCIGLWKPDLLNRFGGRFPKLDLKLIGRTWPRLPMDVEADLRYLDAMEIILRSGSCPDKINITVKGGEPCLIQP